MIQPKIRVGLYLEDATDELRQAAAESFDYCMEHRTMFLENSFLWTERIRKAFASVRLDYYHFSASNGYGYDDAGRDALEAVYAQIFGAEAALVRQQIVSGTHALSLCLGALLKPGDLLVSAAGAPYDTLRRVIGAARANTCDSACDSACDAIEAASATGATGANCIPESGSLIDEGIKYQECPLTSEGGINWNLLEQLLLKLPRVLLVQRSRGYSNVPSRTLAQIEQIIALARKVSPETVVLVDNCYGEFVEKNEPPSLGADLTAGSLIKNPGGGLAPGGGYVVGNKKMVDRVAARLYAPVIKGEIGPSLTGNRLFFQGLFLAPHFVAESLAGAVFTSALGGRLGYDCSPGPDDYRTDIIQSVNLRSPERLIDFCRGLQQASPVGAHICPEPAPMPGYPDPVVMAGGTFVQGASMELSADAPLRDPYTVFIQGGFSVEQIIPAIVNAFKNLHSIRKKH